MSKRMSIPLIILTLWATTVYAQSPAPDRFLLKELSSRVSAQQGLRSNVISEIRLQGDQSVWLGTGRGLAVMRDSLAVTALDTLQLTDGSKIVLNIGVSAIAVAGDSVFVATATDDGTIPVGGGVFYTTNAADSIITWTYFFEELMDEQGDTLAPFADRFFRALPITTDHANVTYDASIAGNYIWITSWAGGLRRYDISNRVWDRVPLPEDDQAFLITCEDSAYIDQNGESILKNFYLNPRDPVDDGNHNHKAFSVLAYNDTVWVGTANGINRGIIGDNGCVDWEHYTYPTSGLTGNFVVSLARQDWNGRRVIWAATLNADDPSEQRGLSYSIDDGESWYTALIGERVYNVMAQDSLVFAGSERGLWKSMDGQTWALFKPARDATPLAADEILSNKVFSIALDNRDYFGYPVLWIGTQDGLARSADLHGSNWTIFRAEYDSSKVYAYPNPFSPYSHNLLDGDGYLRFHTGPVSSYTIEMTVYNFGLEKVYETVYDRRSASGTLKWSGRDRNGRLVANGTYFINLKFAETEALAPENHWLKLILVK